MTTFSFRLWTSFVSVLIAGALPAAAQTCTGAPGTICAWGANNYGQIGNGAIISSITSNPVPLQISGPSGIKAMAASNHNLALTGDGQVWAWGYNAYGQLGSNINLGTQNGSPIPARIVGLSGVVAVAANYHSLALTVDGHVWAWGLNNFGQLGNSVNIDPPGPNSTPSQIAGLSEVVAIAAGAYHSLAVTADGHVWSWGFNAHGELGNGTSDVNAHPTPGQVAGLSGVIAVAAGDYHSLAVTSDGHVWAWGLNDRGQTAAPVNPGTYTLTPSRVPGISGAIAVAAGQLHSLALTGDGRVWGWGVNSFGELGNAFNVGTINANPYPAAISGLSGIKAISAGRGSSLGLANDGQVWAWGSGAYGQLGTLTVSYSSTPYRIAALSGVTAISGANDHYLALNNPVALPPPPPVAVRLVVSAPSSAMAGFLHTFMFSVTAVDSNNQTVTSYNGTLNFTSTDPRAVLPVDMAVTNGAGGFPCQFMTTGTHTITATAVANPSLSGTSSPISVTAKIPAGFRVTAPSAASPGSPFTVNVMALDANNQIMPDYVGTIHFSSSDPRAALPADSYMSGGRSFTATLYSLGSQTITVNDTTTLPATGTSNVIAVSSRPVRFVVLAPPSVAAGSVFNISVTAVDANNQPVIGYTGPVRFTSSDWAATLPADSPLTNGNSVFTATLRMSVGRGEGPTITVTDAANPSLSGTSGPIAIF